MKERFLIVIAALLLCCVPSMTSCAQGGQDDISVKNVPYIVVKGDKLKNVAVRFLVPLKTLKKLNKLPSKNFTCYPGMTLLIPVKVRPHIWDPTIESSSDAGMLSQDRLPSVEYEVIGEGFDLDIKDDFIPASEALDDSVQFVRVGDHILRIDRRIHTISYRIDSLKQAEFGFGHDDDLNSVLGRMRMARDRYYSNGPLGREIDSLHRIKATLNNLRVRLRNRITEYEYLRDNVAYAKANYEREEMAKDTHWGDQITYESNYARIKAKHDEILPDATIVPVHADTAVSKPTLVVQAKDTTPAASPPVVVIDTVRHSEPPAVKVPVVKAPAVAESKPAVPPPAVQPAATIPVNNPSAPTSATTLKPATVTTPAVTPKAPVPAPTTTVVSPATAATSASRSPFGLLQRVDIAPLVVKHTKVEIRNAATKPRAVIPLPAGATSVAATPQNDLTIAVPATKDTVSKEVPVSTDSSKHIHASSAAGTAADIATKAQATAKADTTPHVQPAASPNHTASKPLPVQTDTAQKHIASVAKTDTAHKSIIAAHDTAKHTTAAATHKDTVSQPATMTTIRDTARHTSSATVRIDTPSRADSVPPLKPNTVAPLPADGTKAVATAPVKDAPQKVTPPTPDAATAAKNPSQPNKSANTTETPKEDHNFSLSEDNILGSNTDSHVADSKQASPKAASTQADAATPDNDDSGRPGSPGRFGRKPKTDKKDKRQADVQDQAVIVVDSSKILHEQEYVPVISREKQEVPVRPGPFFVLDMKYDSAMLYREKKINIDPLASYKTDSNFMATDVMLKEIPITEVKNKPRYLMPTDSINKIKGEFYLIRARQVLERGDFKEGDKYLRKSLELDPNNASTWMLHADLCLTTGAADKALKEYAISGEIDSTNPKVFYNIALLYSKANDNQKAYKYFSRATDVNDKYLLAYMGRATVLMDERDYEGAIQDYDKTLSINRYYSPAYKGRALAKMEAHKFEDAIVDFNQYLEIEDPDGYVLYQRGIAKILSNNLLQGCLDLSSSLELGFKEADRAIKKFCQ